MRWRNPFRLCARSTSADCEEWRPGDQAECIFDGDWLNVATGETGTFGPIRGEIRIVTAVFPGSVSLRPVIWLQFDRYPGAFNGTAFRRIDPKADTPIAAQPEFLPWLRSVEATERL